jgi:hypothetical protein
MDATANHIIVAKGGKTSSVRRVAFPPAAAARPLGTATVPRLFEEKGAAVVAAFGRYT